MPAEEVCRELEAMVEKGRWPGFVAAGFTGNGQLLEKCCLTYASGKADIKRGTSMGCDTIVRLYSMTKAFIGLGVLLLQERGRLNLDDPVHVHLPEKMAKGFRSPRVAGKEEHVTHPAKSSITIRQLLTHSSGIGADIATGLDALTRKRGRWEGIYKGLTAAVDAGQIDTLGSFVEALSELPLWQHPGREFYYSYGYDVLGYVLELISGLSLEEFLRREILDPLDMKDTGFAVPRTKASRLATLYRHTKAQSFGADGKKAQLRPVTSHFVEGRHCRVLSGGGCVSSQDGGLISTLRDYSKFLVMVFNHGVIPGTRKRLLSKASAAMLLQNHCSDVGGLKANGEPRIFAHNRKGIGLNLLGEIQLEGCEADDGNLWFDGQPGLIQWGGAATTFYKFQRINGRPLLLIFFTQVLPQDDGRSCTAAFQRMRSWAETHPLRKRGRTGAADQDSA